MFNSIKEVLLYFLTIEDLNYIFSEDFYIDEELFYY